MIFLKRFILLIAIITVSVPLFPETLFIKDGTVIEGTVVENGDKYLIFRDKQKKLHKIPQKDVSMILSSKFKYGARGKSPEERSLSGSILFELNPGYIIPLGVLSDIGNNGYGAELSLTRKDFIMDGFETGIMSGFYFINGKDLSENKSQNYNRFFILPLYFTTGYNLSISEKITLIPEISIGAICFDIRYIDHSTGSESEADRHDRIFDPAVKAGVSMRYIFTESISASLSAGYTAALEKSGLVKFIVFNAGAGYRF